MAKKILSKKEIIDLAKKVSIAAKKDKMPIDRVFIFGSYAKNKANELSDLDLCFISSKFKDTIEAEAYLRTKIFYLFSGNTPMDIVAFKPKDFTEEIPLAAEIRRYGQEIKI